MPLQTGQTLENPIDPAEVEFRPFGHRVPANDVPIELNRLVDDRGEFADNDIEACNALCAGLLTVAKGDLKQTLGNG